MTTKVAGVSYHIRLSSANTIAVASKHLSVGPPSHTRGLAGFQEGAAVIVRR